MSCGEKDDYIKTEGMIWNTMYHITFKGRPEFKDSILPVLNKVSESLSVFDKNSLVTKLNSNDSVLADEALVTVYDKALDIYYKSDGRFDPTVSPLIDAWGFGLGHKVSPDTLSVDSILSFVGMDKTWRLNDVIYKKDIRTRFNFSAIAKGYGCDAVAEMFERNRVTDFMVEIGGEIRLSGIGQSGKDWRIAIDAPVEGKNPSEETAMILQLTDVGIATSGNYRNFRVENGKKLAHTISAVTGKPYLSEILSATVISSDCMEADGLATACMAGTAEEALQLLNKFKSEGMLILSDTNLMTPGFPQYILKD